MLFTKFPDFNYDSQGCEYGYDFAVEADPSVKLHAEMDVMSESPQCYLTISASLVPQNSSFQRRCKGDKWGELRFDGKCMAGGLESVNRVASARVKLSRKRP